MKKCNDDLLDVALYNGKYNVYAGINERWSGGKDASQVRTVNVFVIDAIMYIVFSSGCSP